MATKRILLIANKNWEVEPILNALLNKVFRPNLLADPDTLNYPWKFVPGVAEPRAVWDSFSGVIIELWCIQDILDPKWNPSSSQGKNEDIHKIFNYTNISPDLVIALGTAAFGDGTKNNNGCVVIGSEIFLHNYHPNGSNPASDWDDDRFEKLIDSSIPDSFFDLLTNTIRANTGCGLLRPFLNSSDNIQILSDRQYLGVSTINVTDYNEYTLADKATIDSVRNKGISLEIGSVETTHGIIRLHTDEPFVFMSGITDREGKFDTDVDGKDSNGNVKTIAQNFTAAFNIGVCLGNLLPSIASFV